MQATMESKAVDSQKYTNRIRKQLLVELSFWFICDMLTRRDNITRCDITDTTRTAQSREQSSWFSEIHDEKAVEVEV